MGDWQEQELVKFMKDDVSGRGDDTEKAKRYKEIHRVRAGMQLCDRVPAQHVPRRAKKKRFCWVVGICTPSYLIRRLRKESLILGV